MTKGKIVLVPSPFDDLSATKVRPTICLTDPMGPHDHIVLVFITSIIQSHPLGTDLVMDSSHSDFGTTGLRVPSTFRLRRLMIVGRWTMLMLRSCVSPFQYESGQG